MLAPIAEHLEDRFRCVMLEQRGTGRSRLERSDDETISFDAYIGDIEALRIALKQERMARARCIPGRHSLALCAVLECITRAGAVRGAPLTAAIAQVA